MHTTLDLKPHPEGGRFQEVYRAGMAVNLPDGRTRAALTHIYFQLAPGEVSRFHRVRQDEVWNLYEGAVRLWILTESGALTQTDLSAAGGVYCAVVPAGCWQAAEPVDGPGLVGCTVAPGFDFADFELITGDTPIARNITELGLARLL
jgi:uncharacterized protein